MIRAHATAALAAIRAVDTDMLVYDLDEVPNLSPTPYVVFYIDNGRTSDGRFTDVRAARAWRIVTTFIGSSADEARWAAEKTFAALDDRALVVPDRKCSRCRNETTLTVAPDQDDEDIYFGNAVWTFVSRPA